MSATLRPISLIPSPALEGVRPSVAVRWEISSTGLLASRGAAVLNGHTERLRSAALVVHAGQAAARAELAIELASGERHVIGLSENVALHRLQIGEVEHAEAADLIVLATSEDGELLYARTPLISQTLGLPGGTYDGPAIQAD